MENKSLLLIDLCNQCIIVVSGEVAHVPIFTAFSERVDFMKKVIIIYRIYIHICDSHLLIIIISSLILAYLNAWFTYDSHMVFMWGTFACVLTECWKVALLQLTYIIVNIQKKVLRLNRHWRIIYTKYYCHDITEILLKVA